MYAARHFRRALAIVMLVTGLVGGLTAASARADGSDLAVAYQINVGHNGVQTDASLIPPFFRRWHASLPGQASYPLVAEGLVFITVADISHPSTLVALDQGTGDVVWSQDLGFARGWAAAAYDAGRVYVVGSAPCCVSYGLMRAYAASTGAPLWTTQLPGQVFYNSPPTAGNGVVYTGASGVGGTVYAVSEADGALLATHSVAGPNQSSPALSDTSVFVAYNGNQAYGFSQTSLSLLWDYLPVGPGGGNGTVTYAAGRVYTRDFAGNLIFDANSGALLGSYTNALVTALIPAVDSDSTFTLGWPTYPPSAITLDARNIADGTRRWSFAGDGGLSTAPILLSTPAGEYVVEGSSSGMLYALGARTGTVVWSTYVGAPIPQPDEINASQPLTGLAAGQGLLIVPTGDTVTAYAADTTAPTIEVPDTIRTLATSLSGATINYTVSASDPDDKATISCAPASGTIFPVGTTTVHCTATDTANNTSSANFDVVVAPDTTSPTITVPSTIVTHAISGNGATINYAASASDPDDVATLSCAPASGTVFPAGATTVSCTAVDGSGNATTASFLVVVSASGADCALSDYPVVKGTLILKNANLSGCYLPGANLSGANATNANFSGAYLTAGNLSSATLSQADLEHAVLRNANLSTAKLSFANLSGADTSGANLTGASWNQTTCPDGTNSNANGGTCSGHG